MHLTVHCLTCEYGTNLKFGHLTLFRWFYSWEQFYINRLNTQWVATNWSWKLRNPIRPLFVDPVTFMAHCALLTPQVCTYTLFMFIETLWSLTVTYRKQNIVYLPVKLQWLSAFVYNNIVISLNYNLGTSKCHPGACMPPDPTWLFSVLQKPSYWLACSTTYAIKTDKNISDLFPISKPWIRFVWKFLFCKRPIISHNIYACNSRVNHTFYFQ